MIDIHKMFIHTHGTIQNKTTGSHKRIGGRPNSLQGVLLLVFTTPHNGRYVPNVAYEIHLRGELLLKGVIIGSSFGLERSRCCQIGSLRAIDKAKSLGHPTMVLSFEGFLKPAVGVHEVTATWASLACLGSLHDLYVVWFAFGLGWGQSSSLSVFQTSAHKSLHSNTTEAPFKCADWEDSHEDLKTKRRPNVGGCCLQCLIIRISFLTCLFDGSPKILPNSTSLCLVQVTESTAD